jgi:cell division protein FtsW (lipid II flippase)
VSGNFNFHLDQLGLAGAGVLLIIVGIALANVKTISSHWGYFCIALGVCILSLECAKDTKEQLQIAALIVCAISFLVALAMILSVV